MAKDYIAYKQSLFQATYYATFYRNFTFFRREIEVCTSVFVKLCYESGLSFTTPVLKKKILKLN